MAKANPHDMNNRKNAEPIQLVGLDFIEDKAIDDCDPLTILLDLESYNDDSRQVIEAWHTVCH